MTSARAVLNAAALVAAGRFLVTPTWPCALVALGSLALVVVCEVAASAEAEHMRLKEERASAAERVAQQLADTWQRLGELDALARETQARAERLEANRALGG